MPASTWTAIGKPNAKLEDGALRLIDDGKECGHYRAAWKGSADDEIIVETKVKVVSVTGSQPKKPATSLWPWRDGAPVMVQVSDVQATFCVAQCLVLLLKLPLSGRGLLLWRLAFRSGRYASNTVGAEALPLVVS